MNTDSLTRNTLNDPMVLSVEQSNEALPPLSSAKADSITNFFERLNQSMKSVDLGGTPQVRDNNAPQLPQYTADYKPKDCINKKHVYSINELLSISKQIPEGACEEIVNSLPKKKFWRLNRRYSDHGNHSKGLGHRNGRNAGVNSRPISNEEGVFERRNSKSKATRPKRGNKHGKNDKNGFLLEEKDIAVNNEDLLALEGEFEPTGNSMADFETWKAKMKEMELKKKGLIGNDTVRTDPVPEVSMTSSSISDFLKLNTKKAESTTSTSNGPNDANPGSDQVGIQKREGAMESLAGTSSRFSSFFNNSASSVSLPSKPAEVSKEHSVDNSESTSSVSSGSRLMSFFNKDQERREQTPVYPNEQSKFMPPPPGLARQDEVKGQHTLPAQFPMAPMQGARPQQSQTNNAFFQGLLNKGKISESLVSAPPGVPVSNNAPHLLSQGQRLGQAPPRNVGVPPGFCIGMPPPGFGPPIQGGSIHGPSRLPMMTNVPKESGSPDSTIKKKNPQQQPLAQRQVPMQPGMYHQFVPGMAPPGFPLMQGMPQGFNPNMFPPSNGIMPSNGQQFFPQPPLPPPQAAVPSYSSFPNQPNAAQEGKTK
ncbi:hypothetical protein HG536_0G04620 [Torulaspora globosa]|uniref:Uncharacterized protein n=1 Tax=Torulaspora globosa TaxID=48254 RepID=A0A7G3ZM64_9SACH|nr:uncharacterized protein HG536_0G04620 [Torulaspora globosa]QLL34600.1 hypothetical protein HG536_0G04620 [Torulaspora globosa]